MADELKIACIGAGSSGAGHIVLLEQYEPGCVVAFCDIDRTRFDKIIGGYLAGSAAAESGDFRTAGVTLRADLADIPFYTDTDKMLEKAKEGSKKRKFGAGSSMRESSRLTGG